MLKQPNLGTATILVMDGASLLFLAGLSWWWIVPTLSAVAAAIPMAWQFLHDYQKQRVLTFLTPAERCARCRLEYQPSRNRHRLGGNKRKRISCRGRKRNSTFFPEKQTDFIVTSVGEEFGLLGCTALLLLYAAVIGYGVRIAISSRSQFGRLLALGLTLNFFFYIMINGLMVMGLIPVVGIPMPLLSYGGTAMLTVMFGFGILMSVHIHRQIEIPRHSGIFI